MSSGWAKKEATASALESSTGLWIDTTVMLTSRHRAMHFGSAPACVCASTVTFQRGACFSFDEKNDRWAATIVALHSPPLVSTFQSTAPDQHATFFFPGSILRFILNLYLWGYSSAAFLCVGIKRARRRRSYAPFRYKIAKFFFIFTLHYHAKSRAFYQNV